MKTKTLNLLLNDDFTRGLTNSAQTALAVLGSASLIAVSLTLPGLAQCLGRYVYKRHRDEMRRIYIREKYDPLGRENKRRIARAQKTLFYLRKRGYISFDKSSKDAVIQLTENGKRYLTKLKLLKSPIEQPKKWDGAWWLVFADIPTKTHRKQADLFRIRLKELNFYSLQRTVWIYPHDPTMVLNGMTEYYDLGKFVTLVKAVKIDFDDLEKLKKYYNL